MKELICRHHYNHNSYKYNYKDENEYFDVDYEGDERVIILKKVQHYIKFTFFNTVGLRHPAPLCN